jgi:2-oxoglutarate dehydrogenase E2 component (dihydrolipoamide succinyltransferase)
MTIEIRVPALPESVTDASVLSWHKQPGEQVQRDDNLLELETDKVVLEVPAPADGIMGEHMVKEGDLVSADDLLATLEPQTQQAVAAKVVEEPASTPKKESADPVLTPAVRRLVKELDLDPSKIKGTGKDGRILKSDIMQYMDQLAASSEAGKKSPEVTSTPTPATAHSDAVQRVPMTRLRSRIAERLLEAQQNAAILTTFNEVNLQTVMDLRKQYGDTFEKSHGVRLGFMSFFVKAVVEALKKFPLVNAAIDGNDIVYHNYYDIGIAVGSPRGLVVPILRNADQLSFAETEETIRAFGSKAQDGSLSYEELTGGTFTISNGGVYGSMLSTPILNPPQSAILGMHNIIQRPMAENGEVVIRPMMYLALSYDHRIVDGREAVQFLVTIKNILEDPARMLLQL